MKLRFLTECRSKTQDLIFVVDISKAVSDEDLEYVSKGINVNFNKKIELLGYKPLFIF